jgi:MFS family permease
LNPEAKSAIKGAWLGFFVDMFDVYLPVVVLAPAIAYFLSPEMSATSAAIVGGSIFAATLIGRPLGALIFGVYADRIGRRKVAMIAVGGFGVATLLMAFLPGYQQLGITAVIIFVALRFVDGIFLGGEYTAASPLAMEHCPKEKRGYYGALIMTGFPLAYAAISLLTFLLLLVIPAGGLDSPYVQWGWRIPFVFGALIAFAFVAYYYYYVEESEVFEDEGGSESPLRSLLRGDNFKNFLQVFVLMSGFWLSLQTLAAILPGLLGDPLGLSSNAVTFILIVVFVVAAGGYMGAGVISQRIGRRPFLALAGVGMVVLATPLYYLLISFAPSNIIVVLLMTSALGILIISNWGLATSYINERFQTGVRATGFGLGYSLAVIIPSFYAYYQAGLAAIMPFNYTVLPLLAIGGILLAVGAMLGPETKDVDFHGTPVEGKGEPGKATAEAQAAERP